MDKKIYSKFNLEREVISNLKFYDPLLNLILNDTEESLRDPENSCLFNKTQNLSLVVLCNMAIILISPIDSSKKIKNLFVI
ncbi:putative small nuclear ribonucleo protein, partial [Jimgerdemannia flammicorona]